MCFNIVFLFTQPDYADAAPLGRAEYKFAYTNNTYLFIH